MVASGETHVNNGTMVVPYTGSPAALCVSISATLVTAAGSAAASAMPYVTVTSDGILADGSVVAELILATPAIGVASLVGGISHETAAFTPVGLYPQVGDTTTLTLHFNGATSASAVFTGA